MRPYEMTITFTCRLDIFLDENEPQFVRWRGTLAGRREIYFISGDVRSTIFSSTILDRFYHLGGG